MVAAGEVDYVDDAFIVRIDDKGETDYLAVSSAPGVMPRPHRLTNVPERTPASGSVWVAERAPEPRELGV